MRYTDTIAAVLMIAAGAFTIWYWIIDLTDRGGDGLVVTVERWSSSLSNWVASFGGVRLGLVMSIVLAVGGMAMLASGRSGDAATPLEFEDESSEPDQAGSAAEVLN